MTIQDYASIGALMLVGNAVAGIIFKGLHDRNVDAHGGIIGKVDLLVATTDRTEEAIKELAANTERTAERLAAKTEKIADRLAASTEKIAADLATTLESFRAAHEPHKDER